MEINQTNLEQTVHESQISYLGINLDEIHKIIGERDIQTAHTHKPIETRHKYSALEVGKIRQIQDKLALPTTKIKSRDVPRLISNLKNFLDYGDRSDTDCSIDIAISENGDYYSIKNLSINNLKSKQVSFIYHSGKSAIHPFNSELIKLNFDEKGDAIVHIMSSKQLSVYSKSLDEIVKSHEASKSDNTKEDAFSKLVEDYGIPEFFAMPILNSLDPSSISKEGTVSRNMCFHITDKAGKPLFVKVVHTSKTSDALTIGKIESMANYLWGVTPELSHLVAGSDFMTGIQYANHYLSIQNDVSQSTRKVKDPSIYYWLDAFAKITVYGDKLRENVVIPKVGVGNFDKVLDSITSVPKLRISGMRQQFEDYEQALSGNYVVVTDTKKDNQKGGKVLDLERVRLGHLCNPLPLLFAQNGYKIEDTLELTNFYIDRINHYSNLADRTDLICEDKNGFYESVRHATFPILLNELAGLDSRQQTKATMMQRDQIKHYLHLN